MADVRLHVLPHTGRSDCVELEAGRSCVVRSHRGCVRHGRAVDQWRRARRLRAGASFCGHALDGSDARGRRVIRHGRHGGRALHLSARRKPVGAKHAARQTGKRRHNGCWYFVFYKTYTATPSAHPEKKIPQT